MCDSTIDTYMLIEALEDNSGEIEYALDRTTGEILQNSLAVMTLEQFQAALAQQAAEPERYVAIDPISSAEAYEIMGDFVEQLTPSETKERLARALSRDRPFRRFKDELYEHPVIRQQWFRYHRDRMIEIAAEWMQENGIEQALRPLGGSEPERAHLRVVP